jgi:transposase
MWTAENRARYDRSKLRYPSDLTDDEWVLVKPLIPPAKHGGRKREVDERQLVNGIMYVLSTGCQWRYVPKNLPPKSTLHDYLDRWNYDGTLEKIHHAVEGPASIPVAMMRARRSRARNAVCHERTKRKGGVVLYER